MRSIITTKLLKHEVQMHSFVCDVRNIINVTKNSNEKITFRECVLKTMSHWLQNWINGMMATMFKCVPVNKGWRKKAKLKRTVIEVGLWVIFPLFKKICIMLLHHSFNNHAYQRFFLLLQSKRGCHWTPIHQGRGKEGRLRLKARRISSNQKAWFWQSQSHGHSLHENT